MNRDLDLVTLLLLDPCLTIDEARREIAARGGNDRPTCETRPVAEPREMQANRRLARAVAARPRAAA
jgi:hypothetical protein